MLLLPPEPVVQNQPNWPLLTVSKVSENFWGVFYGFFVVVVCFSQLT
jgi:hypothetical protein